jgi:hypothetical protein
MAKATTKSAATKSPVKADKKKPAPKKAASAPTQDLIVKVCEASLAKLVELDKEFQLQSEINWCLGSYNNDQNPVGLYHMAERALAVFKEELSRKTKGVTSKLVGDIEKALKAR